MRSDIETKEPAPRLTFLSAVMALAVLSLLGLMSVFDLLDGPGTERQERIAKTPPPPISLAAIKAFPGMAKWHVAQRYALKDQFIALNTWVKLAGLGHVPSPQVMAGMDGFLFLAEEGAVELAQGVDPLDTDGSEGWRGHFAALSRAFETRGIPFVFVLAPNKHTVHADALPDWLAETRSARTRTDEVLELAKEELTPPPVDLRTTFAALRNEDASLRPYHRTDTHWNERGAALAMQAVLEPVGVSLDAPSARMIAAGQGGDLARMLGWQSRLSEETPVVARSDDVRCELPDGQPLDFVTLDILPRQEFSCISPGSQAGRALIFMDSFGIGTVPTLSASFQESRFVWTDRVDLALVDEVAPDLVIQILVERKLQTVNPASLLSQDAD